jgi:hypothetical protein
MIKVIHDFERKMDIQNKLLKSIKKYIDSENNPQILIFFKQELSKIHSSLEWKIIGKFKGIAELIKKG